MKKQGVRFTTLAVLFVSMVALSAYASCRDDIQESRPASEFVVHSDGTITDTVSGLMWMRCSVGQNWDGNNCNGNHVPYQWQDALNVADKYQYAGYSDWRLPNKNELTSIIEERCYNPSINEALFPSTAATFYWTSSSAASKPISAWVVNFFTGSVDTGLWKVNGLAVRLVRAGQ